jgi:hypothetical protein
VDLYPLLIWRLAVIVTNEIVGRFLTWKLPSDFQPDCGVSFVKPNHPTSWPVGTNLLTATQARDMLEHVLRDVSASSIPTHQQRVIDEKCQLDTRLQALEKFISGSVVWPGLPTAEQQRMRRQRDAMVQYSSILAERIESFPVV